MKVAWHVHTLAAALLLSSIAAQAATSRLLFSMSRDRQLPAFLRRLRVLTFTGLALDDPALTPFWEAAKEGRLLLKSCLDCGAVHYYPRPFCPTCWSDNVEWIEASGKGTIYSYSVMRRAPVPYAMANVTLAEGPRMMSRVEGIDATDVRIGMAVRARIADAQVGSREQVETGRAL